MKLIIVSGLSGSGKSVALHSLEDAGYYCIDNLPMTMLPATVEELLAHDDRYRQDIAIGIDARTGKEELSSLPGMLADLIGETIDHKILFLEARNDILLRRFSETRRKHPLTRDKRTLSAAIQQERELLSPIREAASVIIDTSNRTLHQLRRQVHDEVAGVKLAMQIEIKSFGYKHGIAEDADLVFDARCLPNPYWQPELRSLTGVDQQVQDFLLQDARTSRFIDQLVDFAQEWIPNFRTEGRAYLTIAIGCTGGQHRSVFVAEQLASRLGDLVEDEILIRHRELP